MTISVPWEALKPNCASDVYIHGDILFCKISSNNFEVAMGSAIGLQFLLSEDITTWLGYGKTFLRHGDIQGRECGGRSNEEGKNQYEAK